MVLMLLRQLALPWWRRFESPGGIVLSLHVEGENPLNPDLKGFVFLPMFTFYYDTIKSHYAIKSKDN
jgi:hypothetical protein